MTKDQTKIDPKIMKQLIEQERQMWENTRELMTIRHRVNKRIGNDEAAAAVEKELERCEMALSELEKIESEMRNE